MYIFIINLDYLEHITSEPGFFISHSPIVNDVDHFDVLKRKNTEGFNC